MTFALFALFANSAVSFPQERFNAQGTGHAETARATLAIHDGRLLPSSVMVSPEKREDRCMLRPRRILSVLAVALVRAAVACHAGIATFAEASVSNRPDA